MDKIKVARIRPVSWIIYVQGKSEAEYTRTLLSDQGIHTSPLQKHPDLIKPPVFCFLATPDEATPMTSNELEAILSQDKRVELEFETV